MHADDDQGRHQAVQEQMEIACTGTVVVFSNKDTCCTQSQYLKMDELPCFMAHRTYNVGMHSSPKQNRGSCQSFN